MSEQDSSLSRFIFENSPIRGEITRIGQAWRTVLVHHNYPPQLKTMLGELVAASALLAATLKLNGSLIMQIQGSGPVSLLVVECTGDMKLRATAKWDGELPTGGIRELVGDGRFVITLETAALNPEDGKQTYQGIVPLEGNNIAEMLQNYMVRSEQLDTCMVLTCDDREAAGMLLQKLPAANAEEHQDEWETANHLLRTLSAEELLELSPEELLHRLFHEYDIRLFEPQTVAFECSCSRESVANMLRMLGPEEVEDILQEQGIIEVNCEFCNCSYRFDKVDSGQLFLPEKVAPGTNTRH